MLVRRSVLPEWYIGNLQMNFRVDTSQIGVLSKKKIWIEGRSQLGQIDVDEVMAQTFQE